MKEIKWQASSLKDIKAFPVDARREAGFELKSIQSGESPSDWKPIPTVGKGVREIRIHLHNEYRVMYVASFSDAIYVLHAFVKKTQKTKKSDLDLAKSRYQEVLRMRRQS